MLINNNKFGIYIAPHQRSCSWCFTLNIQYIVLTSAGKVCIEYFCILSSVCRTCVISFKWLPYNSLFWYFSIYLVQKSSCFDALFSYLDILACHLPFASISMFFQQLHMCFYLIVVCSSIIGRVSFDTLSGLVALLPFKLSLLSSIVCTYVCG